MRCNRRPPLTWDDVWAIHAITSAMRTAILSVRPTTYHACIRLLYDTSPVEIILRKPELDQQFFCHHYILEAMDRSSFLARLRHLELKIIYDAGNAEVTRDTNSRIQKVAHITRHVGKLKTLDLMFFGQTKVLPASHDLSPGQILKATMSILFQGLLSVLRNWTASRYKSEHLWQVLKG